MTNIQSRIEQEVLKAMKQNSATSLAEFMKKHHVPGISFVTFKDGKIDCSGTYGIRSKQTIDPLTDKTPFQAASISKPVSALCALMLADEGWFDIDTDVNQYLKRWKVPPVDSWQPNVTVRQLLSHTGSTTVHGFLGYRHDEEVPTVLQILDGLTPANSDPIRVDGIPGLGARYSGGGTTIVQLLLEDVTGQDFASLLQERVLQPLGMMDSTFSQPLKPELQARVAHGHMYTGEVIPGGYYVMPELAAAGLWTTPSDLSHFAIVVQQALKGEHAVISRQVAQWITTPVAETFFGRKSAPGFSMMNSGEANAFFEHGGSNVGFQCMVRGYLDGRGGFAIMTNGDNGDEFLEPFWDAANSVYQWQGQAGDTLANINPAIVGEYKLDNLTLCIVLTGDAYELQVPGQAPLYVKAKSDKEMEVAGLGTVIAIETQSDGKVTELTFQQGYMKRTAKRIH